VVFGVCYIFAYINILEKSVPSIFRAQGNCAKVKKKATCSPRRMLTTSGVPKNFVREGSTNSIEDRGQREQGSGSSSPLVRGSA
jgi:hypothetical protein